jgi:flagellar basal-body rod protein FlgC
MQAMEISRTGLDVEWRRMELISLNLANANTPAAGSEGLYQARRLLSAPSASFATHLDGSNVAISELSGVRAMGVREDAASPRLVYEPSNSRANAAGYVSYPSIDYAEQMTLMIKTTRAYEANIVAMNSARQMYAKALELGRRS